MSCSPIDSPAYQEDFCRKEGDLADPSSNLLVAKKKLSPSEDYSGLPAYQTHDSERFHPLSQKAIFSPAQVQMARLLINTSAVRLNLSSPHRGNIALTQNFLSSFDRNNGLQEAIQRLKEYQKNPQTYSLPLSCMRRTKKENTAECQMQKAVATNSSYGNEIELISACAGDEIVENNCEPLNEDQIAELMKTLHSNEPAWHENWVLRGTVGVLGSLFLGGVTFGYVVPLISKITGFHSGPLKIVLPLLIGASFLFAEKPAEAGISSPGSSSYKDWISEEMKKDILSQDLSDQLQTANVLALKVWDLAVSEEEREENGFAPDTVVVERDLHAAVEKKIEASTKTLTILEALKRVQEDENTLPAISERAEFYLKIGDRQMIGRILGSLIDYVSELSPSSEVTDRLLKRISEIEENGATKTALHLYELVSLFSPERREEVEILIQELKSPDQKPETILGFGGGALLMARRFLPNSFVGGLGRAFTSSVLGVLWMFKS